MNGKDFLLISTDKLRFRLGHDKIYNQTQKLKSSIIKWIQTQLLLYTFITYCDLDGALSIWTKTKTEPSQGKTKILAKRMTFGPLLSKDGHIGEKTFTPPDRGFRKSLK